MKRARALILEDDVASRDALKAWIEAEGFEVLTSSTLAEARSVVERTSDLDLVLVDLQLPDGSGLDLVRELPASEGPEIAVVTGHATVDAAVHALRDGVVDFFTKPVDVERLRRLVAQVKKTAGLRGQVERLQSELERLGRFGRMIGRSTAMKQTFSLVRRVAQTDSTVLILGDTGTGKELVARTIHEQSARRDHPFIAVNCAAMTPSLVESELFGHERGSFTGAEKRRRGIFEQADGGTLFLDEITETPPELQARLLRVLETAQLVRVGGESNVPVNVRLLAATNRDPEKAVAEGKLRQDLYYRLNVFPIELPALSERGRDVELLAGAFVEELNRQHEQSKMLSPSALVRLRAHHWPGNVRELRNAVERAFILAGETIEADHLPLPRAEGEEEPRGRERRPASEAEAAPPAGGAAEGGSAHGEPGTREPQLPEGTLPIHVGMSVAEAEKMLILATLEAEDNNKRRAAKRLRISVKTLYNRLNAYGVPLKAHKTRVAPELDEGDDDEGSEDEPRLARGA